MLRRNSLLPNSLLMGLLLCMGISFFSACSSTQLVGEPMKVASAEPPTSIQLGPGDVLAVKFRYLPDLNEEQTIRPDGKITLPMIGSIQAAGISPEQLNEQLLEKYKNAGLKDPDIVVIVRTMVSQQIYVGGEVRNPGVYPLKGNMTVLDAIMVAGGQNKTSAEMENVILLRQVDQKNHAISFNLNDTLTHTQSDRFYLAPLDVVYVPQNKIDQVDQWVDQNINKIIPQFVSTGVFGYLLSNRR